MKPNQIYYVYRTPIGQIMMLKMFGKGNCIFNCFSSNSRGVGIFEYKITGEHKDHNGRDIALVVSI